MTNFFRKARLLLSHSYFAFLLFVLALVTLGSFVFAGPLGWGSGILYIFYDTWLLGFVAFKTSRALGKGPAADPPRRRRPNLAVLIPARNESASLPSCLAALRAQSDPPDEIYVIDDGSTDGTVPLLSRRYGMVFEGKLGRSASDPRLKAWAKPHTGKAASLNEVWPLVAAEVVVTIDADTILEPGAAAAMRRAFAADEKLAAASGVLAPECGDSWGGRCFELFQTFEYIRAFLARWAWMQSDALLLVSGAFAAYRKDVLEKIGGYDVQSLVEDYDLIHRLHRFSFDRGLGLKVRLVPEARAATDAPGTIRTFLKQRQRWFSGFLQTQFKNKDMVGNPRYGAVGTLMLPIKSADTLQPIYGLVAFAILLSLLLSGRGVAAFIWWIIGTKLALDLIFHFWSVSLYYRWQGRRVTPSRWLLAALATIAEPVSFQLLRHAGALLGWIGFLKGANDWAPQRELRVLKERFQ